MLDDILTKIDFIIYFKILINNFKKIFKKSIIYIDKYFNNNDK